MKRLTRHTTSFKRPAPRAEQQFPESSSARRRAAHSALRMNLMALTVRKEC